MGRLSPKQIATMAPEKRLALIGALWDSLDNDDVPVPSAQRDELDRRSNAEIVPISWEHVRAELRKIDG